MQEKNGSGGPTPRTISNLLRVIIGVLSVIAVMLFIYFDRQRAIDAAWSILSVLLPFLFVLTVVIFVHELGHFLVARWCGVRVKVFSIGFGKEIFGFYDRYGTRWRLAWIPLGGYVKFLDDENSASVPSLDGLQRLAPAEREGAFQTKPLPARVAVVAAGPIANFLLAIVVFALTFTFIGINVIPPRVGGLVPDSPAAKAGFKEGDLIVSIDGQPIEEFTDMQRIVTGNPDRELAVVVQRGGISVTLNVTPERREEERFGSKHKVPQIGIKSPDAKQELRLKRYGPVEAVGRAVGECTFIVTRTLGYLYNVVTRRESGDQLGGVLRIADISGQVATLGFLALIQLTAVLSVSIGLINLFPIPLLDGGHLMFYAIEAVRGRPLSERAQEVGLRIGLAIVLLLLVYTTYQDRFIPLRWIGIG